MPGTATAPLPAQRDTVRRALPAVVASLGLIGASAGVLPVGAAAAATASTTSTISSAARRQPGVGCPGEPAVTAPTFVPISCGDGSAFAVHVRWTYLSRTTGRAKGVVLLDDCLPNCALGHYHAFAARLVFGRVRPPSGSNAAVGQPRFTRLRVVFTSRHPAGLTTMTAEY